MKRLKIGITAPYRKKSRKGMIERRKLSIFKS